ncbi:MAG: hypothetical protein MHM6MM_000329 [Cercozoa sp. M6MM]
MTFFRMQRALMRSVRMRSSRVASPTMLSRRFFAAEAGAEPLHEVKMPTTPTPRTEVRKIYELPEPSETMKAAAKQNIDSLSPKIAMLRQAKRERNDTHLTAQLAGGLAQMGKAYATLDNFTMARLMFDEALDVYEHELGVKFQEEDVVPLVEHDTETHEERLSRLQRELKEHHERRLIEPHNAPAHVPQLSRCLFDAAASAYRSGNLEHAAERFKQAVTQTEKAFGWGHRNVCETLATQGAVALEMNDLFQFVQCYLKATRLVEQEAKDSVGEQSDDALTRSGELKLIIDTVVGQYFETTDEFRAWLRDSTRAHMLDGHTVDDDVLRAAGLSGLNPRTAMAVGGTHAPRPGFVPSVSGADDEGNYSENPHLHDFQDAGEDILSRRLRPSQRRELEEAEKRERTKVLLRRAKKSGGFDTPQAALKLKAAKARLAQAKANTSNKSGNKKTKSIRV